MFKTLMLHPDNTQLMDKAVKLVQTDTWTNYGNRSTKVGSIPGSFLTAITGLPMKIYFTPYSAMAVICLFHLISYFLLRQIGFIIHEQFSVILLGIIFWLNPWRVEQSELYNPAYLFLFATLHLYTSIKMKQNSFWLTFVHVVAIGLCFQTHFSFIILALISIFLYFSKQIKVNWKGFSFGVFLIGLSLYPYIVDRFSAVSGIEEAIDLTKSDAYLGRNFILVYPVIKSLIYFFRMGSIYFGRHIFSEIQFDWIENELVRNLISNIFHFLKWVLAAASLLFSFYAIGGFFKKYPIREKLRFSQNTEEILEKRFLNYIFLMFIAVFIAASLSPVEFNHWHFILCFPAISLFMIFSLKNYKLKNIWIYSVLGLFLVWNVFASLGSRSHSYLNDYERDFFIHYKISK